MTVGLLVWGFRCMHFVDLLRRDVLSVVVRYGAMEMTAVVIIVMKSVDLIRQRLSAPWM